MPDLGNFSLSSSLTLTLCPTPKSDSTAAVCSDLVKTLVKDTDSEQRDLQLSVLKQEEGEKEDVCNGNGGEIRVLKRSRKGSSAKCLDDYVKAWVMKKMELGEPKSRCFLPFLVGAKKMVECLECHRCICPGEEVLCSVRDCQGAYHITCVKESLGVSNLKKFKCPQHACFVCKGKFQWRCVRCSIASHDKCSAWPDKVIHLSNQLGKAVCWRHPSDWRLDKKNMAPTSDIEEIFCRLPLPYVHEDFKIDIPCKGQMDAKIEPPPYMHIRRNIYLVKKKRDGPDVGCTNCRSGCCEDCVCRVQSISCSRSCRCPENCTNRPFRKDKKIKIVKTEFCGWGVEAVEPINKGDFVIEYIGEVIDDALCEQRLWDMKYRGEQNFYMCEIRKDFTIDATFKGNASRFLNHSCDPNCFLEKWQVEGETRVGVFAARSIKVGEPLTYDYRFIQFGQEVKCYCGAPNCQGFLGTKRKPTPLNLSWGAKRKRSTASPRTINARWFATTICFKESSRVVNFQYMEYGGEREEDLPSFC